MHSAKFAKFKNNIYIYKYKNCGHIGTEVGLCFLQAAYMFKHWVELAKVNNEVKKNTNLNRGLICTKVGLCFDKLHIYYIV